MYSLFQLSDSIADSILRYSGTDITGFGIALFVSLSFNFLLWYELRAVHNKFINTLTECNKTIDKIHDFIISK